MAFETLTSATNEAWQERVCELARKQVRYLRQPLLTPATHLHRDLQMDLCERVQLGIRLGYGLGWKSPARKSGNGTRSPKCWRACSATCRQPGNTRLTSTLTLCFIP
jgi:hypothetical protein